MVLYLAGAVVGGATLLTTFPIAFPAWVNVSPTGSADAGE